MEYLVLPLVLLVGFGLLYLLSRIVGDSRYSLWKEIVRENPTVVIADVPGVGLSVMNDNGKELIVRECGKDKVEIWNTDERGVVVGEPLIVRREGEAAYAINEKIG